MLLCTHIDLTAETLKKIVLCLFIQYSKCVCVGGGYFVKGLGLFSILIGCILIGNLLLKMTFLCVVVLKSLMLAWHYIILQL